ncbi:MAG: S8 family serine peptidase [Chitinophagaceae bacterium]|nr:S8 family serine peptidase [Chitinophagaceae bacterium]
MKKYLLLSVISIFFFAFTGKAQFTRYIVKLRDKGTSPYSLSNPSQFLSARAIQRRARYGIMMDSADLPITPRYIDSIRLAGAVTILNYSKWLNQVAIQTTDAAALTKISSFPFVLSRAPVATLVNPMEVPVNKVLDGPDPIPNNPPPAPQNVTDYYSYGQSYGQVHLHNGEFLHNRGFRGQGMQMAVLDAGFYHYLSLPTFDSIRNNGQVLGTWDFVAGNASVDEDHTHGMNCLSTIAANMPGVFMGTAPKTSFYLYRTEDVNSEYPIEEQNWAAGAERADSLGVDVCSVSLGYFTFDNSIFNYTYNDMNGDNTMIARAADMAAKKGMLVVVAAGNEGSGAWHYIISPADADSVMAIGAVSTSGVVGGFSSYGPSSDGQIKPSVAAVGVSATIANSSTGLPTTGSGTSFACPNMAGLATCLWQAFPEVNNISIINNLQLAANRFNNPDNRTGYGIPNMKKAFVQLIKQLYSQQVVLASCKTTLQWSAKADSVITVSVERKLPTDLNYVTLNTQTSTGAFSMRNFNYVDDLALIPSGQIKYRIRMNVSADTTFFLDSATVTHVANCNPQPVLTTSGLSGFGTICTGSSSAPGSFTITGTNLPAGNVTVAAVTGYSYSTSVNGTYTSSLTLAQPGGSYSQVIYVKFTPPAAGTFNGNIVVTVGSSIAQVAVSGTGIASLAAMATGSASGITLYSAVLAGQVVSSTCYPVTNYGIEYSTTPGFPNGSGTRVQGNNILSGNYSVTAGNLAPNTTYYYKAYGVNLGGTAYGTEQSFKTLPLPNGLVIYNSPMSQGIGLHYSITGITPGSYGVRVISRAGQLVYYDQFGVTTNYIDQTIALPVHLSTGVYTLQLFGIGVSLKEKKSFIIH